MSRKEFEQIDFPVQLKIREKARRLAKLIAREAGLAKKVPNYDAVHRAVIEAIERRKQS